MTNENAFRLGALILMGMVIQLMVIGYVFYTDYKGREQTVEAARKGCERDKVTRAANAQGWRNAEAARLAEGQEDVAAEYSDIALQLEMAADIDCNIEYPEARFIP